MVLRVSERKDAMDQLTLSHRVGLGHVLQQNPSVYTRGRLPEIRGMA
jgi:hypothetical protein